MTRLKKSAMRLGVAGLSLSALLSAAELTAASAENMLGSQSQNEGISVLPAPGPVKIDGDLSDWDFSGRIQIFADYSIRDRFSAEAAAMWDKDFLYIAAKWKDPTPMYNMVDPLLNPGDGWKADAMQLRIRSADQISWITSWFFTGRGIPVMDVAKWKDMGTERNGTEGNLLIGKSGTSELGSGCALAYKADADGKGFIQEMRIPWSVLFRSPPTASAGQKLKIGFEFIWGDPTGKNWPIHRYADNMQPGVTTREFFWSAKDVWGDATLLAKGNVEARRYVPYIEKLRGVLPVKISIPSDAKSFTIVIDDANGHRVRNLASDCDPEIYGTELKDGKRVVEVLWDCLDDKGKPVEPGSFKVRGLSRGSLSTEYDMCYYNPGPQDSTDRRR